MELEATVEEEGSEGNKRPCSRKPLPNQNGLFEPQAAILYCDYLWNYGQVKGVRNGRKADIGIWCLVLSSA